MTFISLPFFLFVAVLTLVYFLTPQRYQWVVLLIGSCAFYWINSGWLLLVLAASSLVSFLIGLWLQRVIDQNQANLKAQVAELSREEKKRLKEHTKRVTRRILLLGVALDLGALLFLKYFNFFAQNANIIFSRLGSDRRLPLLPLLLPLGISFYTLQAIAYMTDIYRGKLRADRNPAKFMLFMSFFPQIVQGPIPRHGQLAHQLYEGHAFDYTRLCHGAQLALWGLIKKLVLAERLAIPVGYLLARYANYSGPILPFTSLLYGLQVYTDFSGGMDIARGVSQILGIELELNFKQPYLATSIEDFWRRWHVTMGSWMKDYVFYPLSLSKAFTSLSRSCRKVLGPFVGKRLPAFLAMFIVYFLVGFWHGPNWKYVAYGLWNGLFIMSGILLEGVYAKLRSKAGIDERAVGWRLFRILRTLTIVSLGRFFSAAESLGAALEMFRLSFLHWWDISFFTSGALLKTGLSSGNWFLLAAMLLVLFYVDFKHERGVCFRETFDRQALALRWCVYIGAVLLVLIFGCYGPSYDAASFIYEQF